MYLYLPYIVEPAVYMHKGRNVSSNNYLYVSLSIRFLILFSFYIASICQYDQAVKSQGLAFKKYRY